MPRVVTLQIWHPGCWTLDVTEELADLRLEAGAISYYPPYVAAETLVHGDDELVLAFLRWCEKDDRIKQRHVTRAEPSRKVLRLFTKYESKNSIFSVLFAHNLAPVEPTWSVEGYEYWKVYAEDEEALVSLLEDERLADCEVTALSSHPSNPLKRRNNRIESDMLTARQLDIAFTALREGYYSWPRRVTAQELAEKLGLSAPTVLEHLRKAEAKIVRTFLLQDSRSED